MKPPQTQRRFLYFLVWLMLTQIVIVQSQEFDPLTPVETLVHEVANGTATIVQFAELQEFADTQATVEAEDLLSQSKIQNYFDENFTEDGDFSEKTSGEIVTEWESVAKGLGVSGALLLGAYTLWRRRRQDLQTNIRAGDFESIQRILQRSDVPTSRYDQAGWKQWAAEQGLAGAGHVFSEFFRLSAREKTRVTQTFGRHEQFIKQVYDRARTPKTQDEFMKNFRKAFAIKRNQEYANLQRAFLRQKPRPVYPKTPRHLQHLQGLQSFIQTGLRLNVHPTKKRLYDRQTIGNQITRLLRSRDLSPVDTAKAALEALEKLQIAMAITRNQRRYPHLRKLGLFTNEHYLRSTYTNIQRQLESWFRSNRWSILSRDIGLYNRVFQSQRSSVYDRDAKTLSESRQLDSIVEKQRQYSARLRSWNNAWSRVRIEHDKQYTTIGHDAKRYWAYRYNVRHDQSLWQKLTTQLQGLLPQADAVSLADRKESFSKAVLTKSSVVWEQFSAWIGQIGDLDRSLANTELQTITQTQQVITQLPAAGAKWSDQYDFEQTKNRLQTVQQSALDSLWNLRQKWLAARADRPTFEAAQMERQAQLDLANDPVHVWQKKQQKNKRFYQVHGLMNREISVAQLKAEIKGHIDDLMTKNQQHIANYRGYKWTSITRLKKDLALLESGGWPMHFWSPIRGGGDYLFAHTLPETGHAGLRYWHYLYAEAADDKAREVLREKIDTLQQQIMTERGQQWDRWQTMSLSQRFSAQQIQVYQQTLAAAGYQEKDLPNLIDQVVIHHRSAAKHREPVRVSRIDYGYPSVVTADIPVVKSTPVPVPKPYVPTRAGIELAKAAPQGLSSEDPNIAVAWQTPEPTAAPVDVTEPEVVETVEIAAAVTVPKTTTTSTKTTGDVISDRIIATLNPILRTPAFELVKRIKSELGLTVRVVSGLRTRAKQAELYARGRTKVGSIVTHAGPGYSYHNYGQALDIAPLSADGRSANYNLTTTQWQTIGRIGRELGFAWGGDWKDFDDKPHFEMSLGQTVDQLQKLYQADRLEGGEYFFPVEEETVSEENLRADIITNIESGRRPESVLVAGIGSGGLGRSLSLREYIEENQAWFHTQMILRQKDLSAIANGEMRAEMFSREDLSFVLDLVQKKIESIRSDRLLVDKVLNHQSPELLNLLYFYRTAEVLLKSDTSFSAENNSFLDWEVAAELSKDVYQSKLTGFGNFKPVVDSDLKKWGLSLEDFIDKNIGFKAQLYKSVSDDRFVVSFAGTQFSSIQDWAANIIQGVGKESKQYDKAALIARALKSENVSFVGHSLGGGLAALAGATTGKDTQTFNAAGVHKNTLQRSGVNTDVFPNITNHITYGDILTDFQVMKAISWMIPDSIGNQVYHKDRWKNYFGKVAQTSVSQSIRTYGNILEIYNGENAHGDF